MRPPGSTAEISPAKGASGRISLPGDKSISHRYAMLAALAEGTSVITGYSRGMDCLSTLACIHRLGIEVEDTPDHVTIHGRGLDGLRAPQRPLDAGNSGTTMRLMTGMVAGQPFTTRFEGDDSLSRRPMRRIIEPLERMGARIGSHDGRPPLEIYGGPLTGIDYAPDVPSAQVKSCLLLAGLFAEGPTSVLEPAPTRDHTERAFQTFGAPLRREGGRLVSAPGIRLQARELTVPGDISGAAFWCAAAAATPGGDITIENVGLNPTRTALLDVVRRIGARVTARVTASPAAEPAGTLRIEHDRLESFEIAPAEVPGLIDEIPALAALAAMMPPGHTMTVRGARELRVKETDRISRLAEGFRRMGSEVDEYEDGFTLRARPLAGGTVVDAAGDHRLAMAFAIAATRAAAPVSIIGSAVEVSYPGFWDTLAQVAGDDR
jgi:3-phosphoshikimate 1-carboxyvinyltransferase